MIGILIQIIFGWIYSHMLENILHRISHQKGFSLKIYKGHYLRHHLTAKINKMKDRSLEDIRGRTARFEISFLIILGAIHLPILITAPYAYAIIVASGIEYFIIHRKIHSDTLWGRIHYPHHYEHHINDDNDNWGIRRTWPNKIINLFLN